MTAQTTPSKLERQRLVEDVASMTGCGTSTASSAISLVLARYGVTETPKPKRRYRREKVRAES